MHSVFVHLQYPLGLVDSVISGFVDKQYEEVKETSTKRQENVVCLIVPFKDKKSSDIVRRQLAGLGSLMGKLYDRCSQAERFAMISRYRN